MSFRTIVISSHCKLSYKNNHLIVRNEKTQMIHMSEINTVIIDTTQVSITSYLLCEMMQRKIKVIFCDEQRNPISEMVPYYGSHNTSKRVGNQVKWNVEYKEKVWTEIVRQKIKNQAKHLENLGKEESKLLYKYVDEIQHNDVSNREGHAAKVYFNSLFGKSFNRDTYNNINAALNYGYSIILSNFNKEIVSSGYITQLGIKHKNEYNFFNLSCDLMEPFRILVDELVYEKQNEIFDGDYKMKLVNILNEQIMLKGKTHYVINAIQIYVKSVFDAIEKETLEELELYEL